MYRLPPRGFQPRALIWTFGIRPLVTSPAPPDLFKLPHGFDQVGQRHVGQGAHDRALDPRPEQLRGTGLVAGLAVAHADKRAVRVRRDALDRRNVALERL